MKEQVCAELVYFGVQVTKSIESLWDMRSCDHRAQTPPAIYSPVLFFPLPAGFIAVLADRHHSSHLGTEATL